MPLKCSKKEYNLYMRKYHLQRYNDFIFLFKEILGGKCVKCNSERDLDFDHINPETKLFCLSNFLNYSIKKVLDEIDKCQLLCQKCHNIKNIKEAGKVIAKGKHGTISTYRYCKCTLCKKAKSVYNKNYKIKLPKHKW